MAVVSLTALKAKFQTGDFPTEQDFIDLIDTLNNNLSVAISNSGGAGTYVATPTGGLAPYTYLWSVNTNRSNTDYFIGVDSIISSGQGSNTITLDNVAVFSNGIIEVKVTDANGVVAKAYWQNIIYTAA